MEFINSIPILDIVITSNFLSQKSNKVSKFGPNNDWIHTLSIPEK